MIKGIDISELNGIIDFKKVKEDDIDFVMIRASYGRFKEDKAFKRNIEGALKVGLKVGIYYYSYALTEEQGKEEVNFMLKTIAPYKDKITYPVCIDMEDSDKYKEKNGFPANETLANICKYATEQIATSGYYPLVYASASWFNERLCNLPATIGKWIAWWNVKEDKIDKTKYMLWQYSSEGKVAGIGTKVDLNYSFQEFDKLISYLNNIKKIQEIKLKTGLEDISIQFMSCYKHGQDLINKIYLGLQKIKLRNPKENNIHKIVQKYFGLEDKTIVYLENYCYAESLFLKLYRAICE